MREKMFDEFIKQKLHDHASAVPGDMWERITQHKEQERRGFLWWRQFALVTFMVGVAAIGWFMFSPAHDAQTAARPSTENTTHAITTAIAPPPVDIKAKQVAGTAKKTEEDILTKPSSEPGAGTKGAISRENINLENGNRTGAYIKRTGRQLFDRHMESSTTAHRRVPAFLNNDIHEPDISEASLPGTEDWKLKYFIKPSIYSFDRSNRAILQMTKALRGPSAPVIDCPNSGDVQQGDYYIELFGSPDFVTKKTSVNTPIGNAFLQRKDSSEKPQTSFTAGFRITKELGENMVFKTGLQYSQINEKFSYTTENERKLTTIVTTRTIIGSQGQTIVVRDTSSTEQIGYTVTTTYNRFRSLDIPLLLGYEWVLNDWKVGLNAGTIFNVSSWQEGETLDTNLLPTAFGKNKASVYKKHTGFAFYGGLSLSRNFTDRISLFAEPYLRYNFSSITNSSSVVNEKFKISGILLGVRYKLYNSKATH